MSIVLQIIKICSLWLICCLVTLCFLCYLYHFVMVQIDGYGYWYEVEVVKDRALRDIINSVLEIPHFKKDFIIDRPEYIKTLTPQEWMNVKCKVSDRHEMWGSVFTVKDYKHIPQDQYGHLNCISIDTGYKIARDNSVRGKICHGELTCEILSIAVDHYVLQYPEILWSILKIAERPCDFIKIYNKEPELLPYPDPESDIMLQAKQARREICDKSFLFFLSRKFVLVTIQDAENQRIMDIIVRRQDID
jgi:hypothetical protein